MCGQSMTLAHTISDMHTHNVASQIPNIDYWTEEKIYETFGEPEKSQISRCDNEPLCPEAPPYAVRPAYFWSLGDENLTKQLKILDFGEASFSQDERKRLNTPMPFRPPESFFGEPLGPPADVWAFGCTVFNIFANCQLFDGFMPSKVTILVEMVDSLGALPRSGGRNGKVEATTSRATGHQKPTPPPMNPGSRSRLHCEYRR